MKNYVEPVVEVQEFEIADVITSSWTPGENETPR